MFFVDPAVCGGGFDGCELAGDVVGGGGQAELLFDAVDQIEVVDGRLDHDHVGPLLDVEGDLAQSLVGIVKVDLVTTAIAELRG